MKLLNPVYEKQRVESIRAKREQEKEERIKALRLAQYLGLKLVSK